MRFKEVLYNDNKYTSPKLIDQILEIENLHWLVDSEIENAVIEIKKNTIIWHSGNFYSGNWYYGIFKNGEFYGIFENGIIEGGIFKGKFKSGIR